jgi:hypothetical protein
MPPPIVQKRPIQWSAATYAKRYTRTLAVEHLKQKKRCHKKVLKKVIKKINDADQTMKRSMKMFRAAETRMREGEAFLTKCKKDTDDTDYRITDRENGSKVYYKLKRADKRAQAKAKARYEAKKSASA